MSEENSNNETITIKKDQLWKYSTFLLLAILVVGGIFAFRGGDSGATGNVIANAPPQPTAPTQPSVVSASVDDDAVLGDPNAPVTLIEFSDYQCAFCGKYFSETLPLIKSQYVDTGKVKIVYRDFPLTSIHPQAAPAAEAAECVREKGGDEAYFEYHDILFSNQQILSTDNYKKWAQELGYDIGSCIDSGKYRSEVQNDLSDATASGGQGTPYFVVMGSDGTGIPISGAQPFSVFQQAIEASL